VPIDKRNSRAHGDPQAQLCRPSTSHMQERCRLASPFTNSSPSFTANFFHPQTDNLQPFPYTMASTPFDSHASFLAPSSAATAAIVLLERPSLSSRRSCLCRREHTVCSLPNGSAQVSSRIKLLIRRLANEPLRLLLRADRQQRRPDRILQIRDIRTTCNQSKALQHLAKGWR
jgi:hypothetical protein